MANRILIASRTPLLPLAIEPPGFDHQFPSNVLGVVVPALGLSILGVRVPWYKRREPELLQCWHWLEQMAAFLAHAPAVIAGDLNVTLTSSAPSGGSHFRRILASGWTRAEPLTRSTYFGRNGRQSEIDHVLTTSAVQVSEAAVVQDFAGWSFAGRTDSLSDHAVLRCAVSIRKTRT